jgi:hypothetical protein
MRIGKGYQGLCEGKGTDGKHGPRSGAVPAKLYHLSPSERRRNNIGPDLGTVADKSIDMLLVAILDPNEALEAKYVNYTAAIKDGREISGVMRRKHQTASPSETPAAWKKLFYGPTSKS